VSVASCRWGQGRRVGVSAYRRIGVSAYRRIGVLACWRVGVLACWRVGVLACWRVGVLACWRVGVLECCVRRRGERVDNGGIGVQRSVRTSASLCDSFSVWTGSRTVEKTRSRTTTTTRTIRKPNSAINTPLLQHSNTPTLPYSSTPALLRALPLSVTSVASVR
jgi:hypothetical protein